ncbi:MAG TPA: BspA family leucine-rich repeat surface protein, partial [Prevotella sp.]|nr:BspA family leucine-rich repeat surface protein [Prevotella sp.]
NFNTENVTDMYSMFASCTSLESLDLTNFNTAKVTNMESMFQSCYALKTIYASDKFVTDQVTESTCMFSDCSNLKDYTSSKEDHTYANCGPTGYFTYGSGYAMFDDATGTLTFSYKGFKPEGAYELNEGGNTPEWYAISENIKKVVFDASFANARLTSCEHWFFYCSNLTTIEGIEYLNTAKVTNMNYMFDNCESLKSLDLTKFNTENVTSMKFMFEACTTLISLDVSNFNTAKVTDVNYMFSNCSALTTIYASDNFVTDQVTYGNYMFNGCEKLKDYDGSKTDHNYANYRTGYFSKLVGKNGDEKIGASGETLTAASLALDDEKDFVAYEPFTATTATYNREMKEGTTWATLCLPFEVSLADKNFRAFKLLSADETTNTVELKEIETSIAAGTPVIIKMKEGQTALNFSVANKEIANNVKTAATVDGSYQLLGLYTKKVFDKDADNNCYIV